MYFLEHNFFPIHTISTLNETSQFFKFTLSDFEFLFSFFSISTV